MKVLFIGGTGNISTSVSKLAIAQGIELYILNRGQRKVDIPGAHTIQADIHKPDEVRAALAGMKFDSVVNWIAFVPGDIEQDIALFRGITRQYVFISSASVYQKPPTYPIFTESTPLYNPYWQYSRNKIACEDLLNKAYREEHFPITIVRPSHTYDTILPVAVGGGGKYTIPDRILKGLPIIIHGDGSSLWVVTHAEDFAKGFVPLLGNPQAIGHPFHITSDELLTWNQIHTIIAHALGVEPNIIHIPTDFIAKVQPDMADGLIGDKSWSVIFDNSKIKTFVPGFKATIPFYEGVRRTLAWFDADPSRKAVDDAANATIDRIIEAYQRG